MQGVGGSSPLAPIFIINRLIFEKREDELVLSNDTIDLFNHNESQKPNADKINAGKEQIKIEILKSRVKELTDIINKCDH